MRRFKFGWHGDQGLGETIIQSILSGRKTVSVGPAYDPEDADVREAEKLILCDKNDGGRGVVRVSRVEIRPFHLLDEEVARRCGTTIEELKQNLAFANSRRLEPDEEMRIIHFQLVSARSPLER